jgi:hypothetical protein
MASLQFGGVWRSSVNPVIIYLEEWVTLLHFNKICSEFRCLYCINSELHGFIWMALKGIKF